ncbi:MAG: ChbG/HpnK family deacetylase [Planctomycetota bacterium]|jgi:predicted glycoside hydrolase/deacetylase ChbG (UPF0249 family)|nr:ChbG/HpnK family deacetylase [Planctomycetota bacterium]
MPRVIFNADDFGASPGINRAVISAFRDGVLNSASLIMNASRTEEAIRLAKENPGLRIGVHLNLTRQRGQKALADPEAIPLLAEGGGRLRRGFSGLFLLSLLRGGELRRQAEIEMRAQVEKALASGIRPDHLDSHRHVHMIPALFGTLRRLSADYGITRVRNVNEDFFSTWRASPILPALLNGGVAKYAVLKTFSRLNRGGGDVYFYSVIHTTRLFGRNLRRICVPGRFREAEACFHPAVAAEDRKAWEESFSDYLLASPDRQREYEALLDRGLPERIRFEHE